MLNDQEVSELISKSIRTELSEQETEMVNEHLSENQKSRAFARISRLIQSSLADIAVLSHDGDESIGPGLSQDAKQKMRDSIREASQRILPSKKTGDANQDTTLAMLMLERGVIDEDQLARLIDQWQPTASGSLGDFLVQKGAINGNQLVALQREADQSDSRRLPDDTQISGRQSKIQASDSLRRIQQLSESARTRQESGTSDSRHVVSRFKLIRKLNEGGLGSVWLARDEKLKRTVAIKEMSTDVAESEKASLRFRREAEITGLLEHPNVVPLYQFGSDPKTGQPFYAMRFVGKRTLSDAVNEYHEKRKAGLDVNLDLRRLLSAFIDVCQAIAYAHSRGVIHRDLKPENVALDNFGQVIVLDWGLAKLMEHGELVSRFDLPIADEDADLAKTLDGEIVGTPLYMAPEQAAGDLDNIDEKTDIYGLGAILFAILTGYAPHDTSHGKSSSSGGVDQIIKSIAENEALAPRELLAGIPADLEAICVRAMSRNRFARYSSVEELAEEVERWMAGQTEKQQKYDDMRMEGREIRAKLQSTVNDLSTNARFMASLPPIQEIIKLSSHERDEETNTWRDRLAVIYAGLLRANRDYSGVGYCRVLDDTVSEIVRVERHSTDQGIVRSVPLSRLSSGKLSDFDSNVIKQKPDEVFVSLVNEVDGLTAGHDGPDRNMRVGVPVFDDQTEEVFGYVWIECELQKIVDRELQKRVRTAQQVVFVDQNKDVWLHDTRAEGVIESSSGKHAPDLCPEVGAIVEKLQQQTEFICVGSRDKYATRIELGSRHSMLYFVLTQHAYEGSGT